MSTNTQILKGIRCPECLNEQAFVVQVTWNVVMHDDGADTMGSDVPDDHFSERVAPEILQDGDPIQCYERRGGCGRRGTVAEFRIPAEELAELEARLDRRARERDAELARLRERLSREDG